MSKPYDAVTRHLIETDPLAWLRAAGLPGEKIELVDANLSTVTAEADRILRVHDPEYIANLEPQSSFDRGLIERLLRYSVLIFCKYGLAVASVLLLLRRQAERERYPGVFSYRAPDGSGVEFRYQVIRVWELDAAEILRGPLVLLPLAPLTENVSEKNLPDVLQQMETRLDAEAAPSEKIELWTGAFVMLGLKYKEEAISQIWKGVAGMKESVTYQMILKEGWAEGRLKGIMEGRTEGRAEGERKMLLLSGEKRLGAPDAAARAEIETMTSSERLESLATRLWEVESWQELLQGE